MTSVLFYSPTVQGVLARLGTHNFGAAKSCIHVHAIRVRFEREEGLVEAL